MSDVAPQEIYGFGSNYFHALGGCEVVHLTDNNNNDNSDAVQVRKLTQTPWDNTNLTDIQCTTSSTLFLTQSGKLYQVGTMHGVLKSTPQLVHVPYPLPVAQVATGRHYCLAVLQGGAAVLSWGAGHFGQLGLGPNISVAHEPTLLQHLLPQATGSGAIATIAAGSWHAAAITKGGRAFMWGSNRKSQCGAPSPSTLVYPHPLEQQPFVQISCGRAHTLGLAKDGKVYSWGASAACGHSSRKATICPPRLVEALSKVSVTQVAAGESHSLALTGGGRVFGWGNNTEGQLGLGIPAHLVPRPKLISDLDFVAIVASGEYAKSRQFKDVVYDASPPQTDRIINTVVTDGSSLPPPPPFLTDAKLPPTTASQILPLVPKIVSIAASGSYSLAVSSAGHVYGWGYNDAGVVGVRPTTPTMPMIELPSSSILKGRLLEIQSFDSRHNVLLPRRLDALSHLHVSIVAPGPCHLFLCGKPRSTVTKEVVGRTLYEIQHTAATTTAGGGGEAHVMIVEEDILTEDSPPPQVVGSLTSGSPTRAARRAFSSSDLHSQASPQPRRRASSPPPTRPAPPRRAMSNLIRRIGGKTPEDRPTGGLTKTPSRARKLLSIAFGGK